MSPRALAAEVQRLLARAGFDPGPADGVPGRRTRDAIRAYQRASALPEDGRVSPGLARHLARTVEQPAPAPDRRADPAVVLRPTPVRARPQNGAPSSGSWTAGMQVTVLALSGRWARARAAGGSAGWVRGRDLRIGRAAGPSAAANGTGGGAGWLRRLTGWLGGGDGAATSQRGVTIGVRGLDRHTIEAARPDPRAYDRLRDFAASETEARARASRLSLASRSIEYPDAPGWLERLQGRPGAGAEPAPVVDHSKDR